jgi:NodT family efflux transporter outer membrane factor (OMF) lipoprotein
MGARLRTLSAALLLAGCAAGPDFQRPAAPQAEGYLPEPLPARTASAPVPGGQSQSFAPGADIPAQWWSLFRSPELSALVAEALDANPNLQAAMAALRVARENVYAQEGAYYPSVQANASSNRQRVADPLSSPLASGSSIFTLHTAQLNISYAPDVFGLNRRQVESLQAQAESLRFQLEAAYLTLTSSVVLGVIQEASLRAQLASTREIIRIATEQLELARKQLELGAIAEAGVVAQEAALAQARANVSPLEKQLAQQRDALATLAGRFASDGLAQRFEFSSLALPDELPVTLPSSLVEQRPDVRAAEAQLHSASAQVGVAVANMLPQITLGAGGGNVATQVAHLFSGGNPFWTVTGAIAQPIFQGGALLHRKRAAEAAYDQSAAQYRATVLNAFQNVADALQALQHDARALEAAAAAERATAQSLAIARRQLELGDISYLNLLNAQQAYHQSVIALVQAQASRYADTAALFQALGGGWWNR